MKKIDKIMDLIIKEILNPEKIDTSEKNVITQLLQSGYNMDEIDEAFDFIFKKLHENGNYKTFSNKKIRVLTNSEKFKLSAEANCTLLQHYYNNDISYENLEEILGKIEENDKLVDLNNLNNIIQKILFKQKIEKSYYLRSEIN